MVKLLSAIILTLGLTPVLAADTVTDKWWGTQYKQLQMEQQTQTLKKEATRCEEKMIYYRGRLLQDPSSRYYRYKLDSWSDRCKEDSLSNPYIQK